MRVLVLFLFASLVWAQAPTGLTVQSATNTQVQLTWTGTAGTSYTVERAPVGAAFTNLATLTATSYTDTFFDAYLQFTYQIVATGSSTAAPSNPVTVGPPPSGLSLAAASPLNGNQVNLTYGENVSLTFDGNGDPAFAFLFGDPNADDVAAEGQLFFRSWNRAKTQWNPLVLVATPGDASSGGESVVSLGYDTSTKTFALATDDIAGNIDLYVSTNGGATWSLKTTFSSANGPALALSAGNIYFAYQADSGVGLQYVTGKLSADPGTWTTVSAPVVNNAGSSNFGVSPAVAIDSSGSPAVAFWAPDISPDNGGAEILFFWMPAGNAAPVAVVNTSNEFESATLGVRMVFYQTNPRIGFTAITDLADANADANVHYIGSNDGGKTWQPAVSIPTDGHESTDYPLDIAVDASDNGAMAYESNEAEGDGSEKCDSPKLALSSDLVNWTVCQVAPDLGNFNGDPGAIQIGFGGNSKRYVFWQSGGDSSSNSGVVMYRDPPNNQPTGPVISNVLDAESARATIVPGEFVALYGANFVGTTRTWAGADFTAAGAGNLPMSLSGVGVQFNGLPAAVYFISPTQLDVQAPSGITGTVPVTVTNNGAVSGAFNVAVVQNAPSLYYYPAGSNLYPAAVHLDGTLIGDPALTGTATKVKAGETIILFVNGVAPSPSGVIIGGAISYSGPVTVTIGPAGTTPGFTGLVAAGEYQMNVTVPSSLTTGDYPITVTVQGQTSPSNVILPVQ